MSIEILPESNAVCQSVEKPTVVAGFRFVKACGDHKSSCRWIVQTAGDRFIIGHIVRLNLDCNGQIAWRAVDRVGNFAGYGRTRGDAAFSLLAVYDSSGFGVFANDLVSPPEYSKKLQDDAAQADLELEGGASESESDSDQACLEIGRLQNQRLENEVEGLKLELDEFRDKEHQLEMKLQEAYEELNKAECANVKSGGGK